jgi:hypothetical protein
MVRGMVSVGRRRAKTSSPRARARFRASRVHQVLTLQSRIHIIIRLGVVCLSHRGTKTPESNNRSWSSCA